MGSNNTKKGERQLQVLLLGANNVGKSTLLHRYVKREYHRCLTTIGVDRFLVKININNENVNVCLWDTAGNERYIEIIKIYFKLADGMLLLYDVTRLESFAEAPKWLSEFRAVNKTAPFMMVGTKVDLECAYASYLEKRMVPIETVQEFADQHQVDFIEASAKTGENVDELFERITRKIMRIPVTETKVLKAVLETQHSSRSTDKENSKILLNEIKPLNEPQTPITETVEAVNETGHLSGSSLEENSQISLHEINPIDEPQISTSETVETVNETGHSSRSTHGSCKMTENCCLNFTKPVEIDPDQKCIIKEFQENLGRFLEEKLYTDISISVKCGDGWVDFLAHKLVLSMWSPIFADICSKYSKEIVASICIEDVSPDTFDAMLKFMYGFFPDHQWKDLSFVLKLYRAATAYEIEALKNVCNEVLTTATPDENNVFQLLGAGKLINSNDLVQSCYKVLQTKTTEVLVTQELSNITPDMLKIVLDMPILSFTSEYDLILWVLAWVENELVENTDKTFKEILESLFPYLNFLSLTYEEFAKIFLNRKSDIMSEQEGLSIFMNIVLPGSYPLPFWCPSSPKHREYRNLMSSNSLSTTS